MDDGCDCQKCKDCCWHNPGWFGTIEEIEGAAKIMKMSTKEFCKEYLIQEWMSIDNGKNSIPAPRRNFDVENKYGPKLGLSTEISKLYTDMHKENKERNGKGFVRATWGHNLIHGNPCIFLDKDNKCKIHKSKPQECRETFGCKEPKKNERNKRNEISSYWNKHQVFIKDILYNRWL